MTNATEHLTDLIEVAMDNVHDMDVTFRQYAEAAAEAVMANVPDLEWGLEDRNGGFYCGFYLAAGFSAYYDIQQSDYDLAEVSYGISCHEFGDTVIWKGPKAEAKAAANDHHRAQLMKAMGLIE